MSADNGVYILVTNRGRGKREYRVRELSYSGEAESIIPEPHSTDIQAVDVDAMISLFAKCKVFTDQRIAEGYAMRMVDEIEARGSICEYGVKLLNCSTVRFPKWVRVKPGVDEWQEINNVPDRLLHRTGFI